MADPSRALPAERNWPLRAALWSVVFAAVGYLALSLWVGWRDVLAALVQVGPWVLLGLLALSLSNYVLRFVRWSRYLALLDVSLPWHNHLAIYFSGFALTTSPGKLGEMLRSVLLKPYGVPAASSLAAFFAERASDLLSIIVLAAIGLWVYVPARPVVGLALLAVCLTLALAQWTAGIAAVDRWAMPRPQKWAKLLVRLCEIVLHFRRCFSLPAMSMGLIIGVLAWFAEGFGFWWLLAEIGHPLPLTTAVFIYAFAMLVGALSFLPGGLGSSEAVMFGLLVLNGVPEVTAVTATLICRLATLWFAVALGAACLARQR